MRAEALLGTAEHAGCVTALLNCSKEALAVRRQLVYLCTGASCKSGLLYELCQDKGYAFLNIDARKFISMCLLVPSVRRISPSASVASAGTVFAESAG